ncbi:hypothetical protein B7P43_G04995 [Cryptotermes secundus]|nr:hypothetical protein B7P43_G04995 [Cryptotermes secundus]
MFKPGTSFLYSTHGWTLVSAVVEAAASEPFPDVMRKFFQVMGLKHTYLDVAEPLIYNRSRYYSRNGSGNLKNVPYVDNSCKWAGGGLLSTVGDLLLFGNAMLYSYQWRSELNKSYPPDYLSHCRLCGVCSQEQRGIGDVVTVMVWAGWLFRHAKNMEVVMFRHLLWGTPVVLLVLLAFCWWFQIKYLIPLPYLWTVNWHTTHPQFRTLCQCFLLLSLWFPRVVTSVFHVGSLLLL